MQKHSPQPHVPRSCTSRTNGHGAAHREEAGCALVRVCGRRASSGAEMASVPTLVSCVAHQLLVPGSPCPSSHPQRGHTGALVEVSGQPLTESFGPGQAGLVHSPHPVQARPPGWKAPNSVPCRGPLVPPMGS